MPRPITQLPIPDERLPKAARLPYAGDLLLNERVQGLELQLAALQARVHAIELAFVDLERSLAARDLLAAVEAPAPAPPQPSLP